jgi:hypothetical protein
MKYLINLERIQGIDRLYVWIINARLTEEGSGEGDDNGDKKMEQTQTAQWKGTIVYLINLERIQGIDRLYNMDVQRASDGGGTVVTCV